MTYDALGNIQSRSDVGTYLYGGSRPHAVSSVSSVSSVVDYYYDSNGNVVRRDRDGEYEFTAKWNSFNKPVSLFAWDNGSEFEYDVNGKRTQQLIYEGTNITKKIYVAETYEIKERLLNPAETNRSLWVWQPVHSRIYVGTPAGKIGIYEQAASTNGTGAVSRNWMHKDHLGSVIALSDAYANITYYSYDAWGNRRDADDWSPMSADLRRSTFGPSALSTDRGYTGHEQLDHLQLVHMNGRIYDSVIGKMISPDPLIQSPENLQSFNRYAYVWNNPLSYKDPSGFITESLKNAYKTLSGDGSGGGGGNENYCEPVESCETTAARDTIHKFEQNQRKKDPDVTIGSSYDEFDDEGNIISTTSDETTISGGESGGESSGGGLSGGSTGQSKTSDVAQNGLGTGGGTHDNVGDSEKSSNGTDAAETKLGKGKVEGTLDQSKGEEGKDPAESGKGKGVNGTVTDAKAHADGETSQSMQGLIDKFSQTDYAKTRSGQRLLRQMQSMLRDGRLMFDSTQVGRGAEYQRSGENKGAIYFEKNQNWNKTSIVSFAALFGHEMTHLYQHAGGDLDVYDFQDEREAYNVSDSIATEMIGRKTETSDEWIHQNYDSKFDK